MAGFYVIIQPQHLTSGILGFITSLFILPTPTYRSGNLISCFSQAQSPVDCSVHFNPIVVAIHQPQSLLLLPSSIIRKTTPPPSSSASRCLLASPTPWCRQLTGAMSVPRIPVTGVQMTSVMSSRCDRDRKRLAVSSIRSVERRSRSTLTHSRKTTMPPAAAVADSTLRCVARTSWRHRATAAAAACNCAIRAVRLRRCTQTAGERDDADAGIWRQAATRSRVRPTTTPTTTHVHRRSIWRRHRLDESTARSLEPLYHLLSANERTNERQRRQFCRGLRSSRFRQQTFVCWRALREWRWRWRRAARWLSSSADRQTDVARRYGITATVTALSQLPAASLRSADRVRARRAPPLPLPPPFVSRYLSGPGNKTSVASASGARWRR
jgi:hypothetical protein